MARFVFYVVNYIDIAAGIQFANLANSNGYSRCIFATTSMCSDNVIKNTNCYHVTLTKNTIIRYFPKTTFTAMYFYKAYNQYCILNICCMFQITINSVPAPMSTHPSADFTVKSSCRNMNASSSVITTDSLSTGTTLDASPI